MKDHFDAQAYIEALKQLYKKSSNAETAFWMEKYMKNNFKCYGIKKPERDLIKKDFIIRHGYPPVQETEKVVERLWREPERELQYFAMDLLYRFRKILNLRIIELYEKIITEKSWWDTVDYISASLVGYYFEIHKSEIQTYTSKWMNSGNMWLQRSCILYQLKYKKATDFELLKNFILQCNTSREFFIQKAIGWALREYSKTDPFKVAEFVANNELKPLSRREAMRIIVSRKLI